MYYTLCILRQLYSPSKASYTCGFMQNGLDDAAKTELIIQKSNSLSLSRASEVIINNLYKSKKKLVAREGRFEHSRICIHGSITSLTLSSVISISFIQHFSKTDSAFTNIFVYPAKCILANRKAFTPDDTLTYVYIKCFFKSR